MVSPLLKRATDSKSFLWTFPECPVRIHVSLEFIENLRKVLNSAAADQEVGGLLIGKDLPRDGEIEVSDYFQLPPGSESTRNFVVCSDSLAQSIRSASSLQGKVVGFYRTHLDQRIQLRSADLECARSKFNDPMNVFLVIRPHEGRPSAAFFFWQDGAVNGGLTFPFSRTELSSSSWATLVGGSPRPSRLNILLGRAREWALEMSPRMRTALIAVVTTLLALGVAWRIYQPTSATSGPLAAYLSGSTSRSTSRPASQSLSQSQSQALGLRVEKALMGVVIAWNPETPEIVAAKDADLLIWDGPNPPVFIRLTSAQLRAGRAFFTSVSDRVEVRMDIIGAAGNARTESIVAAGRAPDILSAEPPAVETSPAIPTKNSAPLARRTTADSLPPPAVEKPNTPARVFTPLARVAQPSGGLTELPKPPELESPATAALPLTQTFHSFNDPQTALPPRPPPPAAPATVREAPKQQPVPDAPAAVREAPRQQPAPDAPVTVREAPRQQPVPEIPPPRSAPTVAVAPAASSFQAAVPIREIPPQIPVQLKQLVQGENVVQVLVHISTTGSVTEAKLGDVKGPSAGFLSKIALNAARGWQFRPATQNGTAVPSDKILEFLFRPSAR
jgi:hypothetical protein